MRFLAKLFGWRFTQKRRIKPAKPDLVLEWRMA
jgi:hypothetical protein